MPVLSSLSFRPSLSPAQPLSILLVEDDGADAMLSRIALERCGHQVSLVASGEEALARFAELAPDMVVTDLRLPGMDGCELTRQLKQLCHPHWLPVLFLSGLAAESAVVAAYEAGADDYIAKPTSSPVLAAKLQVLRHRLSLQQQARERERLLQHYRDQAEEEGQVAQHLMDRLVNAELLGDPAVSHWVRPAETYSGDLVAAARTPGGVLHVLLADATGHGLAASLAVMPVIQPFYRMTEKGFGIDTIAREMNRKVRELLPVGRFVAATLAAVDSSDGSIQVWNGGNPAPFLLAGQGLSDLTFSCAHLPLGILPDDSFDPGLETQCLAVAHQLVIYSDGVVEAESPRGEPFGRERLVASLLDGRTEERLPRAVAAIDQHLAARSARDDLSLILVHCERQSGRQQARVRRWLPPLSPLSQQQSACANLQVGLTLSAEELRQMDPVPLLLGMVKQFPWGQQHASQIFRILSELFNNALDHGILGLDASLKGQGGGFEFYLAERARRLAELVHAQLEVAIHQVSTAASSCLHIRVRDSGTEFARQAMAADLAMEGAPHRGWDLQQVRSLCSKVEFRAREREVVAYYDLLSPAP
ncbi:MAG TPA: SpoIIE family protein phosphatase [Azospira sp.]|nr:SpoIIE family protein phosphatase [Azospira sp.]